MQNNSALVNVDISCLGCGDMLRENWTARNLRPLIGQFTLLVNNQIWVLVYVCTAAVVTKIVTRARDQNKQF